MTRGLIWINFKEDADEEAVQNAVNSIYANHRDVISGMEYNEFRGKDEMEDLRAYFRKWREERRDMKIKE